MDDSFDDMIRSAMPPVTISDQRLDRLIGDVLAEVNRAPRRARWFAWRERPPLLPFLQFAAPMAVALVLGVVLGDHMAEDWPTAQFSTLYLSATLYTIGS